MTIPLFLTPNRKPWLGFWFLLAGLILVVDFFSGPFIQFPVLYLIPIALTSWYNGRRWGLLLAVMMSLVRFYYSTIWVVPWTLVEAGINATIRVIVFAGFAYLIDRVVRQKRALEKKVRILEGILPICGFCKSIRDEGGHWQPLESYITTHSEAEFTHGFCPACARKHYPEFFGN